MPKNKDPLEKTLDTNGFRQYFLSIFINEVKEKEKVDVEVKKFRDAGVLKTALLLLAVLLGLLVFGAGTARAEEGAVVYGLYDGSKVYACDDKGTKSDPEKWIRNDTVTNLFVAEGVTKIERSAFSFCRALTTITIPDTVTEIEDYAFRYSGLTSVALPENLTKIGKYAFNICEGVTAVTIPDTVTEIGEGAFAETGLTSFTWPANLTKIENYTFGACKGLTAFTVPDTVTEIGSDAFNRSGLTEITIPDTVTEIGSSAFAGTGLTSFTWPANLTEIRDGMFSNCGGLTTFTVPDTVTEIGSSAFAGTGLTSFTWPANLTEIRDGMFSDCGGLTTFTVPDTVTKIGSSAFAGSGLTSLTLVDGVKTLGIRVFSECKDLKEVTIPKSVTEIGDEAFSSSGLTNIELSDGLKILRPGMFSECKDLKEVTIPKSVTEIGEKAFSSSGLTNIELSDGLKILGSYIFSGCEGLKEVTMPDTVMEIGEGAFYGSGLTSFTWPANLTKIENNTFEACQGLTAFTVPDTVTEIGRLAFGSSGLTRITLPENLTKINDYTFFYCEGLKEVTIPDTVTEIGEGAFYGSGLTSFTGPETLGIIKNVAFYGCKELTRITLPSTITEIGSNAFKHCHNLTRVVLSSEIPPTVLSGVFDYTPSSRYMVLTGAAATSTEYGEKWQGFTKTKALGTDEVSLPSITAQTYRGSALKPGFYLPGTKDTDYKVTYENNTNTGTATAHITADDCLGRYTGSADISFTITPAPLTIEGLSAQSRPYDGTAAVTLTGGSLEGVLGSDDVRIDMPVEGTVADASKGTGKAVTYTPPELQGSDKGNYSLTVPEVKADITPAPLTLASGAIAAKTYDGTTGTAVESVSFAGLQNNEALIKDTDYTAAAAFTDAAAGDDKAATLTVNLMANPKTANYTLEEPETIAVKGNIAKATPAYDVPKDLTAVYGQTLKDVTLPQGFSWQDDESTAVGNAGSNTFKATYTPADTANYQIVADIEVTIEVSKATPAYDVPENRTAIYGQTLKDVALPQGFSWQDPEDTAVGNVGSNTFKATYTPEDTANYQMVTNIEVTIEVSKATPAYDVPKDLTAVYGQTLKDVALPAGFSWQDPEDTAVGNAGSNAFKATYTPADPANYQIVADIEVRVTVSKGESTLVVQADKTQFTYGEVFTLTVDVALKPQSRSLTRAAADTVDFYLGDPADNRQLAAAPVENGKATATIEKSNPHYPSGGSADITIVYNGSGSLNKSMGSLHLDITPANGSAQVSLAGWTYGQTGASPVPVSETNGTENVTYAYKTKDAGDDTYAAKKPTNAGQYTVQATFAATQNYKAVTATADFVIEKAQPVLTIAPEAGKEIQVGEPVTLNIDVKGVKDETPEGTVAILGKNLTLKDGQASIAYTPADTKPITLTAVYTPAEGENYTSAEANTTLTAGKKTRERITLSDLTKTYGDPAFTLTPIGGSLQAGEAYTYQSDDEAVAVVKADGTVTIKGAGTAHITVSVAESSAWNPAAATMTLTVGKAKITGVSFEDAAFTEDGAEHKIELTGSLPEGTSVSYENNVQKAPGTYIAKAIIDGGVNYESLELTAVLTINEKPADPTPVPPTPTPGTGSDTTSNPAPENTTNNTTERTTDNTNTGLAGSGTAAGAAVLLSLLALTGLVLWQKSKKQ